MKRWAAPFLLTLLAALPILLIHRDETTGPWRVGTPRFELVWALEPSALPCLACVLLLFWLLRELTDRPGLTVSGAAIFAVSHWADLDTLRPALFGVALLTAAAGLLRHRLNAHRYAPAALALCGFAYELGAQGALRGRAILFPAPIALGWAWMLVPLALYARFERLRGRPEVPITPETPPATRTTRASGTSSLVWIELAVAATALNVLVAREGYLVPPMLLAVGLVLRGEGHRPAWRWHLAFGGILAAFGGYLAWKGDLFPAERIRFDAVACLAVLFPTLVFTRTSLGGIGLSSRIEGIAPPILLGGTTPFRFASGLVAYVEARREWVRALGGLALAAFALLPGALRGLAPSDLYGPLLFRSLFVAALGAAALRGAATAWCPPSLPAPPRPRPAPGSLPRP